MQDWRTAWWPGGRQMPKPAGTPELGCPADALCRAAATQLSTKAMAAPAAWSTAAVNLGGVAQCLLQLRYTLCPGRSEL